MFYTEFWDLAFQPFANDNRPETFVPANTATQCIARLHYSLSMGMGASALFGEAGVGKTRIARMILNEFAESRWLTAYYPGPSGGPREILSALNPARAAAIPAGSTGMGELQAFLLDRARHDQPVLLAVDDVQTARGTDHLELLRTLLNIENDGVKALSILLIGQPAMERKLEMASNFASQLLVRANLDPMSVEETRLYILARLKAAGSRQGIFTKHAAERVVHYSKGLPRQVNRLCEMSLIIAYGLEEKRITPNIVEMAAGDLDLLPAAEATFHPWPRPTPRKEPEPVQAVEDEEDILGNLSKE